MEELNNRQLDIDRIEKRIKDIEYLRQTLISNQEILKTNTKLPRPHRIALEAKIENNKDLIDDAPIDFYGIELSIPNERKTIYMDEAFKIKAPRPIYSKQVFYISPSSGPGTLDRYFNLCFSQKRENTVLQKAYAFLYTCFENPSRVYRYDSKQEAEQFEQSRVIITKKMAYNDISYDDIYVEYMNLLLTFGEEVADELLIKFFDILPPTSDFVRRYEN